MQTTAIQQPYLSTLTTSAASIGGYTGPPAATGAIVSTLSFANKSAAAVTVTVSVYNGTTDFYLAYQYTIAPHDTLVLGGGTLKVTLTNGFYIRALASAATSVDAVLCVTHFS